MAVICDRCGTKEAVKSSSVLAQCPAFDLCHLCALAVIRVYAVRHGLSLPDGEGIPNAPPAPIAPAPIDPAIARIQQLREQFGKAVMVVKPDFPVEKGQIFEWGLPDNRRLVEAIEISPATEGMLVGWFVKLSEKDPQG